jgi:hypothetical protein
MQLGGARDTLPLVSSHLVEEESMLQMDALSEWSSRERFPRLILSTVRVERKEISSLL